MADTPLVSIKPNEVQLEDVRIGWTNFSGSKGPFNKEGDLFFELFLRQDVANALADEGYNVKFPDEEDQEEDEYQKDPHLRIKLKMDGARPPKVVITNGSNGSTQLNADTIQILDQADILTVDIIFRPYEYDVQGSRGKSAWLKGLYVTLNRSAFDDKYNL